MKACMNKLPMTSNPLFDILEITKIQHDGSLESIVAATQKSWLRQTKDRWDHTNQYESLHDQLSPYFEQLGIIEEIKPTSNAYDYVIVLGTTINPMRKGIAMALSYFEAGIAYKKLLILSGERPLDPLIMVGDHPLDTEYESKEAFFDRSNPNLPIRANWQEPAVLPKTESELAHMLFEQAQLPQGFKEAIKVEFIDTPMQKNSDGSLRRPNTADTIHEWLITKPKEGSTLAISHQPYAIYQHAVLKTLLPESFTVETVADGVKGPLHIGNCLDTLARWLYQENIYSNSTDRNI